MNADDLGVYARRLLSSRIDISRLWSTEPRNASGHHELTMALYYLDIAQEYLEKSAARRHHPSNQGQHLQPPPLYTVVDRKGIGDEPL